MEVIRKYFPELNAVQDEKLSALGPLYREWNEKINLISRKDIEFLYPHHILHSLAIAMYNPFAAGMKVIDIGTGGGFPGIPLAIMFPDVQFTLLDSIGKKILVVNEIKSALDLQNVIGVQQRAEEHKGDYDIVLSRALSTLTKMVDWTTHLAADQHWIALKGGEQREIRKELPPLYKMTFKPVGDYFDDTYFEEKWIVDVRKG